MPDVALPHKETATSSQPPIIQELRHGFITHDSARGNDALTHVLDNAHFLAPTWSGGAYHRLSSEVFWGANDKDEKDATHVKIFNNNSWEWDVCMGSVSPCVPRMECRSCDPPSRYGQNYNGMLPSTLPWSIDAQELNGYPSWWQTALNHAVDEYNNSTQPPLQFFFAPTYNGSPADLVVDVVPYIERVNAPYHWGGVIGMVRFDDVQSGEINGTMQKDELETGCTADYMTKADFWLADEFYWWCPFDTPQQCFPQGVHHDPWTLDSLKDNMLHELSHVVIHGEGHVDDDPANRWRCLEGNDHSVNCSGDRRHVRTTLSEMDKKAIKCIYQDLLP